MLPNTAILRKLTYWFLWIVFIEQFMITATVMAGIRKVSSSISCFTCESRNWTDTNCHDPFHPAMSKYVESCKVPKPNHVGGFPARFCVKVSGYKLTTKEPLVIRACSLENMDNQCGNFNFNGEVYQGCILTCDYDGCNHATTSTTWTLPTLLMFIITSMLMLHRQIY